MHAMMPLLKETDFPAIKRDVLQTVQINLGYKCNQSCLHCHVNAGPNRKEMMSPKTLDSVLNFTKRHAITCIDITGGAPEMHPQFEYLVSQARAADIHVMDRCNLTILQEPGYAQTADFLAQHKVEIIASLPCYLESNVDKQRGHRVFQKSISAIQKLNLLGYGHADSDLKLNLVYNPIGPYLPPPQAQLEVDYKRELQTHYGIHFNRLFTLTNMPIARFGSTLVSKGEFTDYMRLLKNAYHVDNLKHVMCRSLISIDYRGYIYDCDFNQMLNIPLRINNKPQVHINELAHDRLHKLPIAVADHCYGCTAGQGSSCGGALN